MWSAVSYISSVPYSVRRVVSQSKFTEQNVHAIGKTKFPKCAHKPFSFFDFANGGRNNIIPVNRTWGKSPSEVRGIKNVQLCRCYSARLKYSFFTAKKFAEQKFQVQRNGKRDTSDRGTLAVGGEPVCIHACCLTGEFSDSCVTSGRLCAENGGSPDHAVPVAGPGRWSSLHHLSTRL